MTDPTPLHLVRPDPETVQRRLYNIRRAIMHLFDHADRLSEEHRLTGEPATEVLGERLDAVAVMVSGVRDV